MSDWTHVTERLPAEDDSDEAAEVWTYSGDQGQVTSQPYIHYHRHPAQAQNWPWWHPRLVRADPKPLPPEDDTMSDDLFPGPTANDITLEQQIACVRRELKMREKVYPRWVLEGRMTQEKATRETLSMHAVLATLEALI